MLKFDTENGVIKMAQMRGNIAEVTSDVMTVIHTVYEEIGKHDEAMGKEFKRLMTENVNLCFATDEELDQKLKETKKAGVEKILKMLAEALGEDENIGLTD